MISAALILVGALLTQPKAAKMPALPPLKVSGVRLTDVHGDAVRLRGVDVCSMEWMAAGDHVLQSINVATQDWHANIIRLPLSQDRWFGKTDDSAGANEAAYHTLVDQAVAEAARDHAYIILDLHWSDMGVWGQNIGQHALPDANSLAFWQAVAARYANRPNVIFDLYNEPIQAPWDVWRNGGSVTENFHGQSYTYNAVGLQQLLDAIRAAGAKNVVMAGGLGYSSQLDMPDRDLLSDPHGNGVLYVSHYYPGWENEASWEKRMVVATKRFPVIVSEFGSDHSSLPNADPATHVGRVLNILREHGWNWCAWCMHTSAGPCLISDWNYTPTPVFGALVKEALAGQPVPIAPRATTAPDSVIYDDKFENGWQSWSAATFDPAATDTAHGGTDAIKATMDDTRQVQFGNVPADGLEFSGLSFWVNGGPAGGQTLYVEATIMDTAHTRVPLPPLPPNAWVHEFVSLDALGVAGLEDLKSFRIGTPDTVPTTLSLDDVTLVGNH